MRKWISFPHKAGTVSRQAHADLPEEAIYEREAGRSGFFGPAAHFHHRHPPTGWSEWQGPLRPRALDLNRQSERASIPWQVPAFLYNRHCQMRLWQLDGDMTELMRNADGDELMFIHAGRAELYCDYGHMTLESGDYLMMPRSTMWRLEVLEPLQILMIEATGDSFQLPDKGLVGPHAIFDPAMLDLPQINDRFLAQQDETPWRVNIKRLGEFSSVSYPFNPLDAIGWHGDLAPVRINWRQIRPLMSHRYHLPPSAHTTFVASRFVVCTFVPRPIESDPGALKVPFYHNNDDFDEVLFYHAGDFFSRDNIEAGMVTFHPCGFTHGPHPKAFAAGLAHAKKFTDEVAVMVDTRDPLVLSDQAKALENPDYANSWQVTE
ncbi:homogentisate 1,2-dioxygenase [Ferrimonas sediminicola]|uniref:Homogentisate 1,2-dioxygenase n=1 Tax=Ferrimonas sediminicola TaxID=2569538 RepID=A0A4V5NUK4_9GAMM|nr:homogentisate 1,2-dioxygenase [Ferrimonas sediminicola]TKB46843.1 homogentisate 1,2-dioxygenase [Ferrimonas sediminicola]